MFCVSSASLFSGERQSRLRTGRQSVARLLQVKRWFLKTKENTFYIRYLFRLCLFWVFTQKWTLFLSHVKALNQKIYSHLPSAFRESLQLFLFKLQEKYIYSSEQYLSACGAFISLSSSLKISASAYERWWHMHMCDLHICIFVHFMFYVDHWLQGKMLNPHY